MAKFIRLLGLILILLVVSCQPQEKIIVVTATVNPTEQPTLTPEPTATATNEPTPTPEGQIAYDGFDEELGTGWTWLNENSDNWIINQQGWLQIKAEDLCLLKDHYQNNILVREVPAEGNFVIETFVRAKTVSNFQQASIYVIEDDGNYFSINRGYCDLCPPKGDGFFSDYMYKNKWETGSFSGRAIDEDLVYLRIVVNRERKEIIAYYSLDDEEWVQLRKIPLLINVNQVGLGASNCEDGTFFDNLIALFDYFEVRKLE